MRSSGSNCKLSDSVAQSSVSTMPVFVFLALAPHNYLPSDIRPIYIRRAIAADVLLWNDDCGKTSFLQRSQWSVILRSWLRRMISAYGLPKQVIGCPKIVDVEELTWVWSSRWTTPRYYAISCASLVQYVLYSTQSLVICVRVYISTKYVSFDCGTLTWNRPDIVQSLHRPVLSSPEKFVTKYSRRNEKSSIEHVYRCIHTAIHVFRDCCYVQQ